MSIARQSWGTGPAGENVTLFTLEREDGLRAEITDWGATLVSLTVPDGHGEPGNVVLGYDSLDGYVQGNAYLGCTVGRVANRIGGARFSLDGETYELDRNHGEHQLHGGSGGFGSRVWSAAPVESGDGPALSLSLQSADGDQGYPGNLEVVASYCLTGDGLRMTYRATTDRPTPVNLTNHAYFNLAGAGSGTILDHVAGFAASRYLVTDAALIPTGEIAPVAGTPLDFSAPARVGARIHDPSLADQGGYDHCFILDGEPGGMRVGARISAPSSGRTLTLATDQPCFQFYSGNMLDEPGHGLRTGFCLESQGYVDAVSHPAFPSVILRPGEIYEHTTEYRFGTQAV